MKITGLLGRMAKVRARTLPGAPPWARTSDEKRQRCAELLALGHARAEAARAEGRIIPPSSPASYAKLERVRALMAMADERRARIEATST